MPRPSLGVLDVGAFPLSLRLAPRVEALGYRRYWIAEHHGERSTSNPTLVIPMVAAATKTIRVGAAGVLLRFQSALAVAQNFRILEHAFAGRIDLGLARAPVPETVLSWRLLDGRMD